ncbi:polysaccharide deacetylase family protein [bacterium]|nr:polysaccharide deacetylase family protein [bacterium]
MHPLILFIDLDEWYHCRWATGSADSRWADLQACFREQYRSGRPGGDIEKPTLQILDVLNRAGIHATFFVLGEIAEWYPGLLRSIAGYGHEIACHGMHHTDMTRLSREQFSTDLKKARRILESESRNPIIGFRAPNLVIAPYLHEVLAEQGFTYDSSVCPSRKLFGKFGNQSGSPVNPYRTSRCSLLKRGDSDIVEIPVPVFPFLRLPGAVSISTRMFGWPWTRITLDHALKTGAASYYTHPYEFGGTPLLNRMTLYERFFLRRTGRYMFGTLQRIIRSYGGRICTAAGYVSSHFKG